MAATAAKRSTFKIEAEPKQVLSEDIDAEIADKVRQVVDKAEKLADKGETASALDQLNNAVRRLDDSDGQATLKQELLDLIETLS